MYAERGLSKHDWSCKKVWPLDDCMKRGNARGPSTQTYGKRLKKVHRGSVQLV